MVEKVVLYDPVAAPQLLITLGPNPIQLQCSQNEALKGMKPYLIWGGLHDFIPTAGCITYPIDTGASVLEIGLDRIGLLSTSSHLNDGSHAHLEYMKWTGKEMKSKGIFYLGKSYILELFVLISVTALNVHLKCSYKCESLLISTIADGIFGGKSLLWKNLGRNYRLMQWVCAKD